MKKKLCIYCPVYNEEKVLPIFIEHLEKVINKIKDKYYVEIVFTDNNSTDNSLKIIKNYAENKNNIFYFSLSKNFGYQASLEITIKNIKGDLFIEIDVDGEDPPELILKFLEKYEEGFDIVYGKRVDRHEGKVLKFLRKYYYKSLKLLSDDPINLDMAEFSLFTDEVRRAIIQDKNTKPFIRSNISRVGYKTTGIEFKREKRYGGESYYKSLFQIFEFAFSGILTSSTLFLRIPLYIFPAWFILSSFLFFMNILTGIEVYFKYLIFIFLIYISFTISFMAIYVARIYKNGLNRPNAFINELNSKRQI
jgi:glycosyltransferase involved in cell wall biosynthesis